MFTINKKLNSVFQNTELLFLGIVLIAAFFLRTIQLAQTPSGFHADEASFYINALAISQTGMDEDGNTVPLSLHSYIDPKPALFSYVQIPFLYLFSNQFFAARIVSVIFALFSLIAVYFLIKELADQKTALLTTVLLSLSPWHIIVSRGTQEVITSFLFFVLALLTLVLLLKNENKQRILLTFCFGASSFLSMYMYHSTKVILPPLVVVLLLVFYKKSRKFFQQASILILVTVISIFAALFVQESSSRISAVSIFSDQGPKQQLLEQIYTSRGELPLLVVRLFYNKVQTYFFAISQEYTHYLSPEFLFFSEAKPTRYAITGHGLLYLIEAPLVLIGIYFAIKNKIKELPILFALLFISPIPASLTTQETPSLLRSFSMVIPLCYFVALGIIYLLQTNLKYYKWFFVICLICAYTWFVIYFGLQYSVQTKYTKPWFRNSPYTKIAHEVSRIHSSYDTVEVTNDLRPLYAYFVMEDLISIRDLQQNPYARNMSTYTLGKFTFNKEVCDFKEIKPNVLYITEVGCKEKNQKLEHLQTIIVITYDDGTPVYELLQAVK